MINLLLAIVFASLLYIVFKFYTKFNIDTFQAIVFNYVTAFLVGISLSNITIESSSTIQKPWFPLSLILGVLFITVFNIMGKTSQVNGLTVASVASKMSMIIPILFGIIYLNEQLSTQKIIGIIFAIFAVYFVTKKSTQTIVSSTFILPVLLFFGAGTIDTSMNYIQHTYLTNEEINIFSAVTFLTAFCIGAYLLIFKLITKKTTFHIRNVIGGISLGIPNYFSMYYLIKALQTEHLESATIFTLINIGVILLTTLFGIILFKERLIKLNYVGILLAIIAVFLLK